MESGNVLEKLFPWERRNSLKSTGRSSAWNNTINSESRNMINHSRFSMMHKLASLLVIMLLLLGMGCGNNPVSSIGIPPINALASGDGITITGQPGALPPGVALTITALTQAQAQAAAALAGNQIFVAAGDFGPDGTTFYAPVTINFPLPNQLAPGTRLPFYMLQNNAWVNTGTVAIVGSDGLTASAQVTHFTKYILFLDDSWVKVSFGGNTLISKSGGIPLTALNNPIVLVSGKTTDETVIAKVMEVNNMSRADAVYFLRSYDTSGDKVVQVLRLTAGVIVTRYWPNDPAGKLGRWFNVIDSTTLYLPDRARQYYALPNSNTALNVTQYLLKPGATVVYGVCADMTWSPTFGPYATGGGYQIYVYSATTWDGHAAHLNPDVVEIQTELRYTE